MTILWYSLWIINRSKERFIIWQEIYCQYLVTAWRCQLQLILLSKDETINVVPVSCLPIFNSMMIFYGIVLWVYWLLIVCSLNTVNMSYNPNNVPMLEGSNFSSWKSSIMIYLGCMDLDLLFRMDKPASPADESTYSQKVQYEKWERSNRLGLMIM